MDKRSSSSTARWHITSGHILQALDYRGLATPILTEDQSEWVVELYVLTIFLVWAKRPNALHLQLAYKRHFSFTTSYCSRLQIKKVVVATFFLFATYMMEI